MAGREVTLAAQLRRAGVADPEAAAATIEAIVDICGTSVDDIPRAVSYLADPDAGVAHLLRLAEAARDAGVLDTLTQLSDTAEGAKLGVLLGASDALADFLVRHPEVLADFAAWRDDDSFATVDVRTALLLAVGADPHAEAPVASMTGDDAVSAMRVEYRRRLVRIAAEDVFQKQPTELMPAVAEALADLAGAALEAGLAIARASEPRHAETRLAIIGMGKCGARELNYVSDVDVIFVAEPAEGVDNADSLTVASRLANLAARACDSAGSEAPLWQVDANLRPEGRDGALVRAVDSHRAYYERWASTWEFQALLKARPIAGDAAVGAAYVDAVTPMIWQAAERENFVEDAQAMRRRVEQHIPAAEQSRQLKLGRGGLRDVEFTIQLLQLVHGRADPTLRVAPTLDALAALRAGGYVGRNQAARMDASYRQLRVWEHRLQLRKLRRTHLMPDSPEGMRWLARASGFATPDYLEDFWNAIRRDVRAMHLEMFYRPLLPVLARLSADEASLSGDAARARLAAVGFADAEGAQRHIAALTEGVSRRAAIQRQLLPAMIGWFAQGPDPDGGLLTFRTLSEQLEDAHWYLKLLRDSGTAAERLARLLSTSGYVAQALLASAEAVSWLADDEALVSPGPARLHAEADAILTRSDDPEQSITALRGVRRRELLRTAAADVLGLVSTDDAARAATTAAEVALSGALRIACFEVARERGVERLPFEFIIVAMGRFGGSETSYTSDADVMFVYDPEPGADDADALAQRVAAEVRQLLQRTNAQPPLEVDADLRPEGKNGPLARSLASCEEYYRRWSDPWEAQALLRARPCVGDGALRKRFVELIDPIRYPEALAPAALKQIRTLKARMEAERLPSGVDPKRHLKLGPGGLADVEWTVQLIQLLHAHAHPELRTPRTLEALEAARGIGLLEDDDAAILAEAWSFATDLRAAIALRGRRERHGLDVVPTDVRDLRVLAGIMGLPETGAQVEQRWVRYARRARAVAERVFFGWEGEAR